MGFKASSADTALSVFFGRDTDGFGESLEKVAVVTEPAFLKGIRDAGTVTQKRLGYADTPGGNVFIDCGAGGGFEDTADIGFTQIKGSGKLPDGEWGSNMQIDVFQNIVHLLAVNGRSGGFDRVV